MNKWREIKSMQNFHRDVCVCVFLPPYITNNVILSIIKLALMPCRSQNLVNGVSSGLSISSSVDISCSLSRSSSRSSIFSLSSSPIFGSAVFLFLYVLFSIHFFPSSFWSLFTVRKNRTGQLCFHVH